MHDTAMKKEWGKVVKSGWIERFLGGKMGKEWGYNQDFVDFEGESRVNIW